MGKKTNSKGIVTCQSGASLSVRVGHEIESKAKMSHLTDQLQISLEGLGFKHK